MTPNGAILFGLIVVASAMAARGPGLVILAALCLSFGAIEIRGRIATALVRSFAIVLPLAIFMALVWIGLVGRAPDEIAAGVAGTRAAALLHVVTVCLRLFLVALAVQLAVLRFAHLTPLQFIRSVAAPLMLKKLTVLTVSLIGTLLHAVDRARTALVAAGIVTAGFSLRNVANGWILIQTAWLSVVTIATGRLRDKWPIENTPARLDRTLAGAHALPARTDVVWVSLAIFAAIAAWAVG
jgi:hypothetical protein